MWIFDIGANTGIFSLFGCVSNPKAQIYGLNQLKGHLKVNIKM